MPEMFVQYIYYIQYVYDVVNVQDSKKPFKQHFGFSLKTYAYSFGFFIKPIVQRTDKILFIIPESSTGPDRLFSTFKYVCSLRPQPSSMNS